MLRIKNVSLSLLAALWAFTMHAQAQVTFSPVITGLDEPWGLDHLPDGGVLITEIDGRLLLWRDGAINEVSGTPSVVERGQGGLLDVTLARDFAQSRTVYLTYSKRQRGGAEIGRAHV